MPGAVDRLKVVFLLVGLAADKGARDGFGPSVKRKAALPWEMIARLSSAGQAQPGVHPASRSGVHPVPAAARPRSGDGMERKVTLDL